MALPAALAAHCWRDRETGALHLVTDAGLQDLEYRDWEYLGVVKLELWATETGWKVAHESWPPPDLTWYH